MQSLGDSTLAAFMKSDITFKDLQNPSSRSSSKVNKAKSQKCLKKNESDIAKYFNESLVFGSREGNRDKENESPTSMSLHTIPESPMNIAVAIAKDSKTAKHATTTVSPKRNTASGNRRENREKSLQIRKKYSQLGANKIRAPLSNSRAEKTSETSGISSAEISDSSKVNANNSEQKTSNYTTNSSIEIPSRVSTPDRGKLSSWGLPLAILSKYKARGVTSMFSWQVDCLSNPELLEKGRNLVYSAPTSAGKTLVAEILLMKTVMEHRKKVIFILPFVSVVREKMYYFQDLLSDSGVRVEGFMGGCAPAGGFAATDVAIATIEKANSLLNQLMEEGKLETLGAVVIDELHLLGDPYRGYLLELLLTKLKYMTLREELVHVQLIGMSATLPNLALLAKWLNAELYKTDFRPVPLNELCKISSTIYDNRMKSVRTLPAVQSLVADSDNILQLCIETIADGHSVLIFCPTKNWCENLAQQISQTFSKLGREDSSIGRVLREQLSAEAITETLEQLKRCPIGLDAVLKATVSFGAAFHHAGLTMDERDIVEGAFRAGALRVLTATSTLSSGVNLPARRVIIRSLMFHGKPLDTLTYRQMIGRAGRMGKDTAGESILVCKPNETKAASALLSARLEPIESCLEGSKPLIRALLEAVASEVAYTAKDIDLYINCTLVSLTSHDLIEESTREAIQYLIDNELFMRQKTTNGEERLVATPLGKACLAASIPPSDGLFIFEELQKARRCFVLDTELHVIYLVTPLNSSNQIGQIDWIVFLDLWKCISESERRVGQLVGVEESFLIAAIRGVVRPGKGLDVHKRFYTALALHELVREVPLAEVCRKYGCCRGVIQGLQQSAATFAGMVTQFCKKLGWSCMELLIDQFQARLQFGVSRELLDLLRLPMLNGLRARSLYKEGITSVAELAVANELDVERALHKALPFESGKEYDGEHEVEAAKRNRMRSVFVTGRDGLTPQEAAAILVREARSLVQNELGLEELQWNQREQSTGNGNRTRNSRATCSGTSERDSSSSLSLAKTTEDIPMVQVEALIHREDDDDSRKNEEKSVALKNETEKSIVELEIESLYKKLETGQSISKTTKSNSSGDANRGIDYQESEAFGNDDIFEFTGLSEAESAAKIVESSKFGRKSSEPSSNVNENREINHQVREAIDNEDIFEFTDLSKAESVAKIVESSKFRKTSESSSNVNENREIDHQVREAIDNEDIFEFTGLTDVESAAKIVESSQLRGKTTKASSNVNDNRDIDRQVREAIDNEDIFEFTGLSELEAAAKLVERGNFAGKSTESSSTINNKRKIDNHVSVAIGNDDTFEFTGLSELEAAAKLVERSNFAGKTTESSSTINNKRKTDNHVSVAIGNDDTFEFTSLTDIELAVKIVESSKFGRKMTESSSSINNNKKIDDQVCKAIGNDDVFEFTGETDVEAVKKIVSSGKSSPAVLLLRESITKASDSRSPSLFGDSLNLDSQECNILEQNVIDSLNISAFEDTNFSAGIGSRKNTPELRTSDSVAPNRRSSQRKLSLKSASTRASPAKSGRKNKSKSIDWDDDSWNNTNGVIDTVNQLNKIKCTAKNSQKDTTFDNKEKNISTTPVLKSNYENTLIPKNRLAELRKIPQKRKLSEPGLEKSPIASVLAFTTTRKLSVDSNKSDTDDIIIPSQSLDPSLCVTKNRTRLKLESLRRSRTQRGTTPMDVEATTTDEKNNFEDFAIESCSIGSVVSNSDDEAPTKRPNAVIKSTAAAAKPSLLKKKAPGTVKPTLSSKTKRTQRIQVNELQITNVTTNWAKFNSFKRELVGIEDIALALGCESFLKNTVTIGTKIIGVTGADGRKKSKKVENCVYGNKKLAGVAVTWDGIVVHYMPFDNSQDSKVPVKDRLDLLTEMLNNPDLTVRCFSFKETYKILHNCCRITSSCKFLDPKTAEWLLDPDRPERSFNAIINEHLNEAQFLLQRIGAKISDSGPGLNVKSSVNSESRATTEVALTWLVMNVLTTKLEKRSPTLLQTFKGVEMGTVALLARMELSGIGVNFNSLQELSDVIQQEMLQLEKKAYSLAGKRFNFASSKSVAQVLGLYKGKKVCTNKAALEHCENPISSLVTFWRKLSATKVKMIFPLLSLAECSSRIHGNCLTNTATGRVSMHEPNLQNVPRDFQSQDGSFVISVRMAFAPIMGNVLLSADYCQLELRILAHFSKETNLCKILRKEGDVFRNIAARWNNLAEENIDDEMRQRTKQLCYGMIYGMGVKTLADTLSVSETEAKEFLESFMSAYPGIRSWLTQVVDEARGRGYVKTLLHRRRYFPALDSQVPGERGQAERQAVNTKVQGSAADIAKKAMVVIDERMRREFSNAPLVLADAPLKRKLRSRSEDPLPRGGFLVLQIHDELLYEVNAADLHQVAKIVKESMEQSCTLRVPLPVKLKIGPTWGDLAEYQCQS